MVKARSKAIALLCLTLCGLTAVHAALCAWSKALLRRSIMHAHCTWSQYVSVCSYVSDDKQWQVCMLGSQNRPYCPDKDTAVAAAAAAEAASQSKQARQQLYQQHSWRVLRSQVSSTSFTTWVTTGYGLSCVRHLEWPFQLTIRGSFHDCLPAKRFRFFPFALFRAS